MPIDSADGEAQNKVEGNDYKGALYFCTDLATDNYPGAEEAKYRT